MCSSPSPWFNFSPVFALQYSDNVTAGKRFSSKFALAPYSCPQTLSMQLMTWRLLAANWRSRAGRGSDGRDLPRLRSSPMVRPSDGPGPGVGDGLGRRARWAWKARPGLHPAPLRAPLPQSRRFRSSFSPIWNISSPLLLGQLVSAHKIHYLTRRLPSLCIFCFRKIPCIEGQKYVVGLFVI